MGFNPRLYQNQFVSWYDDNYQEQTPQKKFKKKKSCYKVQIICGVKVEVQIMCKNFDSPNFSLKTVWKKLSMRYYLFLPDQSTV